MLAHASNRMRTVYSDARSRWISIMDTILAGYGCLRREEAAKCWKCQELQAQ